MIYTRLQSVITPLFAVRLKQARFYSRLLLPPLVGLSVIVLITTSSAITTVSAVSISAISVSSTTADGYSGSHDGESDTNTNVVAYNWIPISVNGTAAWDLARDSSSDDPNELLPYKERRHVAKREGSDAKISSNQDVTTLALATDNSSAVAIANINSSKNNVFVNIVNGD